VRLKVLLPTEVLVDEEVSKVTAEAANGSFCLLPKHVDFVAALVPGLLSYETADGREVFVAADEGVLVKQGASVMVSVRRGVAGGELGSLHRAVQERFLRQDEHEREVRSVMAKIEAGFVRRFLEVQQYG
jgi:F-type H+-transporting ATPase subunit epsilon